LHIASAVSTPPLQLSGPHCVSAAYLAQLPLPSQTPFRSQAFLPLSLQVPRGSAEPAAVLVQVPAEPCELQVRQPPAQVLVQQTPSTQKLDSHSVAWVHVAPGFFLPAHTPTVIVPVVVRLHAWPGAQPLSLLQRVVQAPPVHRNGVQSATPWPPQVPFPSQTAGVLRIRPAQVADTQTVPWGYLAQAPKASQSPVVPQVAAANALQSESGTPASSKRQWPP
jgi:hypothetical protein